MSGDGRKKEPNPDNYTGAKRRMYCLGGPPQIVTDRAQQTKRQKRIKITLPILRGIEYRGDAAPAVDKRNR